MASMQPIILFTMGQKDFVSHIYSQYPDKSTLLPRIQVYLGIITIQAIKTIANLDMVDYKTHTSWSKDWIYISLASKQFANHPWVAACNINTNYFEVYRPFGRDLGQITIEQFKAILKDTNFTKAQYYGFYTLFNENMRVRKEEMIYNPRHSLIKCDNIKQCLLKKKAIEKSRKTPASKIAELEKYKAFYEKKSISFILKYFTMLDARDYEEAFAFLRMKNGKYYGKQRLDTFFVNTGEIIGHLQIFIEIYKLIYLVIDQFHAK